jgi:hypothetical protein
MRRPRALNKPRKENAMSSSSGNTGGIGLAGAFGLLFIGLKLGGVIAWSWLWVLSPFWIPLAISAVILLVAGVIAIVGALARG